MSLLNMRGLCVGIALAGSIAQAHAYTFETQVGTMVLAAQTTGTPLRWAPGTIPASIALDDPGFEAAAREALQAWQTVGAPFTETAQGAVVVRWAQPGEVPAGRVATTIKQVQQGQITAAAIVLDPEGCWDVYHGPLVFPLCHGTWAPLHDVHRVVLHELGHVLGLSHPDEAGQTVVAIMNSHESDLESLTADDVAGLRAVEATKAEPQEAAGSSGGCAMAPQGALGIDILLVLVAIVGWIAGPERGWMRMR